MPEAMLIVRGPSRHLPRQHRKLAAVLGAQAVDFLADEPALEVRTMLRSMTVSGA
jgi:hypothetical protein